LARQCRPVPWFVAEEKVNDGNRDGDGKENAHGDDEQHEGVNVRSEVGGRFRIKWQLRLHGLSVLLGDANSHLPQRVRGGGKIMRATNIAAMVRMPPRRTMRRIVAL